MREVEANQIENMVTSLSMSTDITVAGNLLALKVSGRCSPYKSHTTMTWEFDSSSAKGSRIVTFTNSRYTLVFGAATKESIVGDKDFVHEYVTVYIPSLFLKKLFDAVGAGRDLPEAFCMDGALQMPLVSVGWQRVRCTGFGEDGKPIFAGQEEASEAC